MAKVLNPLNSTEARGRVGGLVYNTWRGIRTVKTHTAPGHEDDPLRQAHKAIVQAAGQRWATITAAQRAAWSNYADQHPDIDWTGKPVRLAGYHWYVRVQTHLKDLDLNYIDDPPHQPNTVPLINLQAAWMVPGIIVTWSTTAAPPAGEYFTQVWMTHAHSAGRTPTLHDAYLQDFAAFLNGILIIPHPGAGYYTIFARTIRKNGLTGTWNRVLYWE